MSSAASGVQDGDGAPSLRKCDWCNKVSLTMCTECNPTWWARANRWRWVKKKGVPLDVACASCARKWGCEQKVLDTPDEWKMLCTVHAEVMMCGCELLVDAHGAPVDTSLGATGAPLAPLALAASSHARSVTERLDALEHAIVDTGLVSDQVGEGSVSDRIRALERSMFAAHGRIDELQRRVQQNEWQNRSVANWLRQHGPEDAWGYNHVRELLDVMWSENQWD